MQTFLPLRDYAKTAAVLDSVRLNKQMVETTQILTALLEHRGWVNHPATHMWRGYERNLLDYQIACFTEWQLRGYRHHASVRQAIVLVHTYLQGAALMNVEPPWLGMPEIHIGYQSNLIRKDREHYGPLFPGVPNDLPYFWPVQ